MVVLKERITKDATIFKITVKRVIGFAVTEWQLLPSVIRQQEYAMNTIWTKDNIKAFKTSFEIKVPKGHYFGDGGQPWRPRTHELLVPSSNQPLVGTAPELNGT